MITELWHHWGLLRPLFVFVLAGPLIMLAALPRRHGQPRGRKTHDAPVPASDLGEESSGPQPEPRVETSPREWRAGGSAPDRRAA
jgi:hypothetical protein